MASSSVGIWINVSTFSYVDYDLNTPLHSLVNKIGKNKSVDWDFLSLQSSQSTGVDSLQ